MRIEGRPDLGLLTYCTNIHPGESWPALLYSLHLHVPAVKRMVSPDRPFGLGLRISAEAADALVHPQAQEELSAFLAETDTYCFTINGFPYGSFHGDRVKENVYTPDWSTPERLTYTNRLADILAAILPADVPMGSISTVPGSFKGWMDEEGRLDRIVENFVAHVAHLVDLERKTGRHIALALEPEPCCLLETIEETVGFFEDGLFAGAARQHLANATGLSDSDCEAALRRHIGVCYDVCHAAIEFEDPRQSVMALKDAGISIPKLQLSSALRIHRMDDGMAAALMPFDEPTYLHQVVEQTPAGLVRYLDLPEALAKSDKAAGHEWRVHFHVPVFLHDLAAFSTTQAFLGEILALHREEPIAPHLEVETYTWDVLPDEYRAVAVSEAIARELDWVADELLR
ncbi:metabolite traffic protein EboE [Microbaculum sp. FT89]|uniref:metabolite traffic protein EboE n=1 Tax=Microbaculum sp. FT89 TaxID=3447298 RepID=UPI003F5337C7